MLTYGLHSFYMKFEKVLATPVGIDQSKVLPGKTVSARLLLGVLLSVLLAGNQLLLAFLGVALPIALAAAAASLGLLLFMVRQTSSEEGVRIPLSRVLGCVALAAVILALGGEGRFAYANADWQIRDAVLRDLTLNSWPYAYTARGAVEILRAPVGMYLLPALAGKAGGVGVAEVALLAQNATLLGILFALGSLLVDTARARLILLAVVIAFSGMDFLGWLRGAPVLAWDWTTHIDGTANQYSSHITQAFWVPQHAIAGWTGAVLFLLWSKGRLSLVQFLVPLPLLALWSPLALMGLMPFAAAAGITTLLRRRLQARDVAAPFLATAVAIPALFYLQAAGDTVGIRANPISLIEWLHFQQIETIPFIVGVALLASGRRPRMLLGLAATCLALVPLIQVGNSNDFMMRASIPALAVLAALVGEALGSTCADYRRDGGLWRGLLIAVLGIGAITGGHEIARSLSYRPTPLTRCDLTATAITHAGVAGLAGMTTYLAPVNALPALLRPRSVTIVPTSRDVDCWERPWKVRRF
jgi:hypothetical protein